jgi:hypothetical protein
MRSEMAGGRGTGTAPKQSPIAASFGKLTRREQGMLTALAALGIVCAILFLVVFPSMEKLDRLEAEAAEAESARMDFAATIAQGSGAEQIIADEKARHDAAKGKLFAQMLPEALDATMTKYMVKAGLDPQTLSMSEMEPESITPFLPQATAEAAPEAAGGDADGSNSMAIPLSATDEAEQAGGSVYSYSVNATAKGSWKDFYKLLDRFAKTDGAEITQYTFSKGTDTTRPDTGSFTMTIKFYVLMPGND